MIAVDCEGPACVVGEPGKSLCSSQDIGFTRIQATREANAAARALFDSGAKKVVIWDNHGAGSNLIFDRLDRRCKIMVGAGFKRRFPEINKSYTGVLMIGYHAMEGATNGVLAHTYSPSAYQEIRVNGEPVGEIALDASVAGEIEAPLIFVASDEAGCKEAIHFIPWIETITTKKGFGRNCALSKHPLVVTQEIYDGVRKAVDRIDEMKPFTFPHPVFIEIRFKCFVQALKARIGRQGWQFTGIKRLQTKLPSMLDWRC